MVSAAGSDQGNRPADLVHDSPAKPETAHRPLGRMLSAQFDFPEPTVPRTFYVVASMPRSGSSFLCQQLWATGLMGLPAEYFNYRYLMFPMVARLNPRDIYEYTQKLFALRTSPNGVFGFKAHWTHFPFIREAGLLPFMPKLRFVHIERADRLAQAVSLVKLRQTRFGPDRSPGGTPVYDPKHIRRCLNTLEHGVRQWRALFQRDGVRPINVTYELLAADPDAVVDGVLRRFGLARDPARQMAILPMRRQADSVNREWIERFCREGNGAAEGR